MKEGSTKIEKLNNEYSNIQSKLNYDIEQLKLKKDEFERYKEVEIKKLEKEKKLIN